MDSGTSAAFTDRAPQRWTIAQRSIAYGILFWACSLLSWLISYRSNTNVAYWLPVGLAMATYLSTATREWGFLVIAQVAGNFIFDYTHGSDVIETLIYCAVNVFEDVAACFLIRKWFGNQLRINVMREFAGMNAVFIAVNLLAVTLHAAAFVLLGFDEKFTETILIGVSSNAMNVITLTPAILIWMSPSEPSQRWWHEPLRNLEAAMLLLFIVGIAWFLEAQGGDILGRGSLAFIIPSIWAGLRFGVRGAAVSSTLMCLVVVICAAHFQSVTPQHLDAFGGYAAGLYGFMALCALVALVPAVAIAERDLLVQEIEQTPTFWVNAAGRIRRVNAAVCRLLRYPSSNLIGSSFEELGLSTSSATWQEHWSEVRRRKTLDYELEFKPPGGPPMRLQANVSWFQFEGTEFDLFFLHDITELRELEGQLRQLQKMELVGQLSGGVAHDFNNQLTVMSVNLGMIQTSYPTLPAEVVDSLGDVSNAVRKAARLTEQLLTFSRKKVFNKEVFDLNELCDQFSSMIRRTIGETIVFGMVTSPLPLPIEADKSSIEQAMLNLCLNARDAMPKGGHLMIRVERRTVLAEETAKMPGSREGTFARLTVEDTGEGIASENLGRIFEPYFTTKDVGKGTGLGLASVLGVVQQHAGWVSVESSPSAGSIFSIYLPLSAASIAPRPVVKVGSAPPWSKKTILLVEDEASVRMLANRILERLGYNVLVANNGRDAQELWGANSSTIDLLLSDVRMPGGLTGIDIAREFRAEKPSLKVILMTGHTADLSCIEEAKAHGVAVLLKPFDIESLRSLVHEKVQRGDSNTR